MGWNLQVGAHAPPTLRAASLPTAPPATAPGAAGVKASSGLLATLPNEKETNRKQFDKYAWRIPTAVKYLSDDEKEMLGALYAKTAAKHGKDSFEMTKVDRLARTLAYTKQGGDTEMTMKVWRAAAALDLDLEIGFSSADDKPKPPPTAPKELTGSGSLDTLL